MKMNKVAVIAKEIGKQHVLAFGNSMPVFQGFILETRLDSLIPLINKDF